MLILLLSSIIARPLDKRQTGQAGMISPNNRCYYYYQLGYSYGFYDGYYYASYANNNNLVGTNAVGTTAASAPLEGASGTNAPAIGTAGTVGAVGAVAPVVGPAGNVGVVGAAAPVVGTTGNVLTKRDAGSTTYGNIPGLTQDGATDFSKFPAYFGIPPYTPGTPITKSNK